MVYSHWLSFFPHSVFVITLSYLQLMTFKFKNYVSHFFLSNLLVHFIVFNNTNEKLKIFFFNRILISSNLYREKHREHFIGEFSLLSALRQLSCQKDCSTGAPPRCARLLANRVKFCGGNRVLRNLSSNQYGCDSVHPV